MSLMRLDYQLVHKPQPRFGLAVLGLVLVALLVLGFAYNRLLETTAQLEEQARALKLQAPDVARAATRAGEKGGEKATAAIVSEVRQANLVLRQLSVPWDTLFQAVEAASNGDVTLLSMAPDVETQGAKIIGEAKNMAAVLNYMRQLGKQPVLHDINLLHHQIQVQDSEKPIRFTLGASWENPS